MEILNHTIPPFFNEKSEILILGSFPSPKSREQGFYYGHPQNRFWQVLAGVFEEETPLTIEEKKRFLNSHHIALFDTIKSCEIKGANDSSIKNVIPNDFEYILKNSKINKIYTTGKKSFELYRKYIGNDNIYLPSTSPLNASYSLNMLIEQYSIIKSK